MLSKIEIFKQISLQYTTRKLQEILVVESD